MKSTCGRMKSDFQYSASIVYNNFPWPEKPTDKQIKAIEENPDCCKIVFDATSASAHFIHAPILKKLNKYAIDFVVPNLCGADISSEPSFV